MGGEAEADCGAAGQAVQVGRAVRKRVWHGVGPRVVDLKRRQSGRLPVRRSSGHASWPCAWPDDLGHGPAARGRSSAVRPRQWSELGRGC